MALEHRVSTHWLFSQFSSTVPNVLTALTICMHTSLLRTGPRARWLRGPPLTLWEQDFEQRSTPGLLKLPGVGRRQASDQCSRLMSTQFLAPLVAKTWPLSHSNCICGNLQSKTIQNLEFWPTAVKQSKICLNLGINKIPLRNEWENSEI